MGLVKEDFDDFPVYVEYRLAGDRKIEFEDKLDELMESFGFYASAFGIDGEHETDSVSYRK
jgi:hypothetical protein